MGQNIGENPVDEFPVEYSVDIRLTSSAANLEMILERLDELTKVYAVDMSYPVMEAMVLPDLDNG